MSKLCCLKTRASSGAVKLSSGRLNSLTQLKDCARMIRIQRTNLVRYVRKFVTIPVLVAVLLVVLVFVTVSIPPFPWLPEAGEAAGLLGTLLTAQAAITALTLSVTIFVIQGASSKQEADDRVYREYIRQSRVGKVFWSSLTAVVVTGATFLTESFFRDVPALTFALGIRNMTLVAVIAFFVNLLSVAFLFHSAVRLARPHHWQTIRRDVNESDVRKAVRIFLSRYSRATAAMELGELDSSVAFPDPAEGSANDAIRALLDDGRRAMAERRLEEAKGVLKSIRELIAYAVEEIGSAGFEWSVPGSRPQWPPLKELGSNIYSFREEVNSRGDVDLAYELQSFDYWCMAEGMRRSCGELFTVGLDGCQHNYEIASRMDNRQLRKLFGEQFWGSSHSLVSNAISQENPLYVRRIVGHFEHLLNDAMQTGSPADYQQLHESFERCIRTTSRYIRLSREHRSETAEQLSRLEQDYQIALMGLGGRAALLASSGAIVDPNPYLDLVRVKHEHAEHLADDIARALAHDSMRDHILWRNWEMEPAESFQTISLRLEKYPLTWFAIRLLELSSEPLQPLNLQGQAQRILNWFETNSEGLEAYVRETPNLTNEAMRQNAIAALRAAVSADEETEDYAIIDSELSADRVSTFKAEAYKSAFATNSIKRLFERAEAVVGLAGDAEQAPDAREFRDWPLKAYLADLPEDNPTYHAPLEGDQIGRAISDDVVRLLCETLGQAPHITASLNTPEELLQAIDAAAADLNASGELVVILVGDWVEFGFGPDGKQLDGYEPMWRIPEEDRIGEIGRYRGHPIVRRFSSSERHLYVVDVTMWGWFVDAPLEPQNDMFIKVNPVSAEQARDYLDTNPELFSDQPDESSKLRKLQTLVEIVASHRTGFLVSDPAQARRISDVDETEQA